MDALSRLLASRDWLMADGATGTNLFNMGLEAGEPPEFWNTDRPDNIRNLYRSAVDAGSDIFLTNTFGGNASRLKLHGAQSRVRELNRVGAALDALVTDHAGQDVVIVSHGGAIRAAVAHALRLDADQALHLSVQKRLLSLY